MAREMEEKRINRSKAHSIFIENRERITINGVEDVESFNAEMVILVLEDGFLDEVQRKALMLKLARLGADRIHLLMDPGPT